MGKVYTRMGDGSLVEVSLDEIRRDLEEGTQDAAGRGKIPPLARDELEHLLDICCAQDKFTAVERGKEIIITFDGGTNKIKYLGIPIARIQRIQTHERAFCSDTMELSHYDYSFKPIKTIVHQEQPEMEQALLVSVLPLFYGAMPNLGLYTKPDGPVPNAAELLPMGKIAEAKAAQEEAVEYAVKDIVFVASKMYESGADGINFDTVGAAGDADFLAALRAAEILKEKYPDICIELGMAGEFVLGMHGELKYADTRLAGLYPHQQVKIAEKAGVTIFGAVVNTNSSKSFPWNLARAVTFIKACVAAADIPVHANVGMGVGAVPVCDIPPIDVVSKVSKAMAEVAKLDGL